MAVKNSGRTGKRGSGRRFAKGLSGNPKGRPRGARNRAALAAKEFATMVLNDPQVQARILADARKGRLAPAVMTTLMAYAWGKPKERVEIEVMEALHLVITNDIGEDVEPRPAPVEGHAIEAPVASQTTH